MAKKYRALVNMSLRKSPDLKSLLYEEWHDWQTGQEFVPPKHMDVERALARGLIEPVGILAPVEEEVKSDG